VRQLIAMLILSVLLVSHGGMQGALPHVDATHAHDHDHAPQFGVQIAASAESMPSFVTSQSGMSHTADLAHHAHVHLTLGLPTSEYMLEGRRTVGTPLRAEDASRLAGRETAPLTQPPAA
jgi:hypothetical protein